MSFEKFYTLYADLRTKNLIFGVVSKLHEKKALIV